MNFGRWNQISQMMLVIASKRHLFSIVFDPGSPDISNMFGEQQVAPRVGDAYQVEIPSMTMDAEQYKLLTNPVHSKVVRWFPLLSSWFARTNCIF